MTEITAINRTTGKFAYHTSIPRKLTEEQVMQDLKGVCVTPDKYIILISYPEK